MDFCFPPRTLAQIFPGFELGLLCPFPKMITAIPHAFLYLQVTILNKINLHTFIWLQIFLSDTNNLYTTIQFQVFLFNINNLQGLIWFKIAIPT